MLAMLESTHSSAFFGLSLLVAACSSTIPEPTTGRVEPIPEVTFELRVQVDRDRPEAVIAISVPSEVTRFEAPPHYGGAPMFLQYVTNVSAIDTNGLARRVEVQDNEIHVAPGSTAYSLHYTYAIPQSVPGEAHRLLPALSAERGRFDNHVTFVNPIGVDGQPARLVVIVPPSWPVHTSWGNGNSWNVPTVQELVEGLIVVGRYEYERRSVSGTDLLLAIHGQYDKAALKRDFLKVLSAEQAIAGPLPSRRLLVVIEDTVADCCHGTALINGIIVNVPSGTPFDPFNFSAIGTIAHELFHLWNLRYVVPESEDGVYLFTEGFTNYFAVAALTRAELITDRDFAVFLSNYRHTFEENPRRVESDYAAIQRGFAENDEQLIDLAYTKGPFVALSLDLALRHDTNGTESLASWFRLLVERYGGRAGYRVDDLRALLVEHAGTDDGETARQFDESFLGNEGPDLDDLFARLGIACSARRECELADLPPHETETRRRAFSAR